LYQAIRNNNIEEVKSLYDSHPDWIPQYQEGSNESPMPVGFREVLQNNMSGMVDYIIEKMGKNLITAVTPLGETVLHLLTESRTINPETFMYSILNKVENLGGNVKEYTNKTDHHNHTALWYARNKGQVTVLRHHGADPLIGESPVLNNKSPKHVINAVFEGLTKDEQTTLADKDRPILQTQSHDALEALIEHGATINNAEEFIQIAKLNKRGDAEGKRMAFLLPKVKDLFRNKPDDIKKVLEYTLLYHSSNINVASPLIKFLQENNAENNINVDVADENENTPLHLTTTPKIMEILIKNGANLNKKNKEGTTPAEKIFLLEPVATKMHLIRHLLETKAIYKINIDAMQNENAKKLAKSIITKSKLLEKEEFKKHTVNQSTIDGYGKNDVLQQALYKSIDIDITEVRNFIKRYKETPTRESKISLITSPQNREVITQYTRIADPFIKIECEKLEVNKRELEQDIQDNVVDISEFPLVATLNQKIPEEVGKDLLSYLPPYAIGKEAPKYKERTGKSVLHLPSTLEYIQRSLGEDPSLANARDNDGNTPLHLAEKEVAREEKAEILIRAGADVFAKNNKGLRPKLPEGWQNFIEFDHNTGKDRHGRTRLFYATTPEEARNFINNRMSPKDTDNYGKLPINYAESRELKEFLTMRGGNSPHQNLPMEVVQNQPAAPGAVFESKEGYPENGPIPMEVDSKEGKIDDIDKKRKAISPVSDVTEHTPYTTELTEEVKNSAKKIKILPLENKVTEGLPPPKPYNPLNKSRRYEATVFPGPCRGPR
ncbi:MAG: hypothetical protein KA998_03605, partial [Rickettsiaceae bacterium]|nr:hypothetical protein [Rickettsiaceae bacterium]